MAVSAILAAILFSVKRARLVPATEAATVTAVARSHDQGLVEEGWLENVGVEPECAYEVKGLPGITSVVAWVMPNEATHFSLFFQVDGKSTIYMTTRFPQFVIKTANRGDEHFFPGAPNVKLQTFPTSSAMELWQHHLTAVNLFRTTLRVEPLNQSAMFSDVVHRGIGDQVSHIHSIPLWWIRIPYWIVTRRSRYHNRAVTPD